MVEATLSMLRWSESVQQHDGSGESSGLHGDSPTYSVPHQIRGKQQVLSAHICRMNTNLTRCQLPAAQGSRGSAKPGTIRAEGLPELASRVAMLQLSRHDPGS